LGKVTITFVMSVRPSVSLFLWKKLGSSWTDFHEIWYVNILRKIVDNIEVQLKYYKNNGKFTWRRMYIYDNISFSSSYNEKYKKSFKFI